MQNSRSPNPEDSVMPYLSLPSPERTPARLWWMAKLRGLQAALPSKSSVVDVGCSTGEHLLSLAELYPEATFVGIDSDEQSIEKARSLTKDLGLGNVSFFSGFAEEILPNCNRFDYVISHGVYTWIPRKEKQGLLSALAKSLAEKGVLYLSHNTLPGWNTRRTVCELLQSYDDVSLSSVERVERARDLLSLMKDRLVDAHRPYGLQLQEEVDRNLARSDAFFLHELLEKNTHADWLGDIFQAASESELQYLGDAHPQRAQAFDEELDAASSSIAERARTLGERAQLFDALYPASFRGSLFVKSALTLSESRQLSSPKGCYLSSPLVCEEHSLKELTKVSLMPFYGPSEQVIEPKAPLLKGILHRLSESWPAPQLLDSLLEEVSKEVGAAQGEKEVLYIELLKLAQRNLVECYPEDQSIEAQLPMKPFIPVLRRTLAAEGEWTITLREELFKVDPLDKVLIPYLDGASTAQDCIQHVKEKAISGELFLKVDGEELGSQAEGFQANLEEGVEEKLRLYVERGLLLRRS